MALTKPAVKPVWAETAADPADIITPPDVDIQTGWPNSIVPPSRQRFNWLFNFAMNGVRYLTRRGIADWAADEPYLVGDYTRGSDGITYRATATSLNESPQTTPAKWTPWGFTANLSHGVNELKTIVASSSTPDIFSVLVGNVIDYTGTGTCTGFVAAPQAGARRTLRCASTPTFTAGANFTIAGLASGESYVAEAGDLIDVMAVTTTQFHATIRLATGLAFSIEANLPKSLIPNAAMQVNQRQGSTVANDGYTVDRWYALTQTGSITYTQQTLQEAGQATNVRLTQTQAVAQRIGFATILESKDSQWLRGQSLTLRPRIRLSNQQSIRVALLEWTGTADSVTSNIVLDWADPVFIPGNFFLAANLNVLGTAVATPSAAAWADVTPLTVTVGPSCNNLIVFMWSQATMAQNVTFDIGKVRLVPGGYKGDILIPTFAETMAVMLRTYQKSFNYDITPANAAGANNAFHWWSPYTGTSPFSQSVYLPTRMRVPPPVLTLYNPSAANGQMRNGTDGVDDTGTIATGSGDSSFIISWTPNATNTLGDQHFVHWSVSADL